MTRPATLFSDLSHYVAVPRLSGLAIAPTAAAW